MEGQRDIPGVLQESLFMEQSVKESEIRLTSFILEYNIANHLPSLIRDVCPDSKIAKQITLGRNKCTSIVKNVIGKYELQKTVALMKAKEFSLILDESTDKSTLKHLCLVEKYLDDTDVVKDNFFALLPIEESGTSDAIYTLIKDYFVQNNIDYKTNMIATVLIP